MVSDVPTIADAFAYSTVIDMERPYSEEMES